MESSSTIRIPLQLSRGCVVASIQIDLSDEVLRQFRVDLLELLATSGASGVILDLSGVHVMDHQDFEELRRTIAMANIMGAQTVISGLLPGVVSSLVDLGVDTDGINATLSLDDAFRQMDSLRHAEAALEAENVEEDGDTLDQDTDQDRAGLDSGSD